MDSMNKTYKVRAALHAWVNHASFGYAILALFLFMEGLGLYVQYVLGDQPCANCVLVRAYLFLIALAAVIAIATSRVKTHAQHIIRARLSVIYALAAIGIGMAFYHSYDNYLVESGRILFASCDFDSPFPPWLPLDSILPTLFKLEGLCGTPAYLFDWLTFTELSMLGLPLIFIVASALYINALLFKPAEHKQN